MSSIGKSVAVQINKEGDNVGGNKITNVFQSIAPEVLRKPIELILSNIRDRNHNGAKTQFEIIKATASLDANSEAILDMLSVHLNLLEEKEKITTYSSLNSFLNNSPDSLSCDLCLSTLIRLDAENNRIDDARERFQNTSHLGKYSKEAFYELVAVADELEVIYEDNRINLDESDLNGLVRGSFRTENLELGLTVANRLNEVFPSLNSKVLLLFAKSLVLFNTNKLQGQHFWTISATLKSELFQIAGEIICLINESNGKDLRLFNLAVPCLHNVSGEHKELSDICWKYIDEVEKINSDIAAVLHNIYAKDTSKFEGELQRKHATAQHDKEFRAQLVNGILSSKNISIAEFIFLTDFSGKRDISRWAKSGGIVSGQENLETDLANLLLNLTLLENTNNRVDVEDIRVKADYFVKNYQDKLSVLNPVRLLELVEKLLLFPKLSSIACDLINPMLPMSDLWVSPIVKCYLNGLLVSGQMKTLTHVLTKINKREWDGFVWIVQARLFEQEKRYKEAITSVEKAQGQNYDSLDSWNFLVYLYKRLNVTNQELHLVLRRVPDEILSENSALALALVFEIGRADDFQRAEQIILSWFIENPNACAKAMTDFCLNFIINGAEMPASKSVGSCLSGVVFKKDNEVLTKLLIDGDCLSHPCLLDVNSSLGECINEMSAGESKQCGMYDITLNERLPPLIATFRMAGTLRDDINDGSDPFFLLNIHIPTEKEPEPEADAFAPLKRILSASRGNTNKKDELLNNPDWPLILKGFFLCRHSPVEAALELLHTKSYVKYQLPNFGESLPSEVVLDIYTIIYLSLTGLAFGISDKSIKFIITEETKVAIEAWLKEIKHEDYMSVGVRPDGGLWRQTADDIKQSTQYSQICRALDLILTECEVADPLLVDMPAELFQFQDIVDNSVYSTMKLSVSNDIPWLSIDETFARLFMSSGWRVVNTTTLFKELGSSLSFEQKKEGLYLYAQEVIPYSLTFQDLILLSTSDDEHTHYFLAKIIFLHPNAYKETTVAADCLSTLLIPVLAKAYLDGEILKGLRIHNARNNGYAERIFNACSYVVMQCDGVKAELAFSMLLFRLVEQFRSIPTMIKLICVMATEFAKGHFLCITRINKHVAELSA